MSRWHAIRRLALASAMASALAFCALAYASIGMGQECPASWWDLIGQIMCDLYGPAGGGSSSAG